MTRIFNDHRAFKGDMVTGFVTAYSRYVRRVPDASAVGAPCSTPAYTRL